MMLIFGTVGGLDILTRELPHSDLLFDFLEEDNSKCLMDIDKVYNFNSLLEGVPVLDGLNPYWKNAESTTQIFTDELSFDNWYVNLITTSPQAFKQIVDIMRDVYNGLNVYILCDWSNEIATNMIEALIKFITDSYGYRCNVINDENSIYIKEGDFSMQGIQLFDSNMETYIKMFGTSELPSDHGDLA